MAEVVKSVLVPYPAQEMFDLVSDVGSYPRFLPWCGGASVELQDDGTRLAQVQIVFGGLRQSFTTRNRHNPGERIDMSLHDGPFRSLTGAWVFLPLNDRACKVSFTLSYHFSTKLMEKLVGPVFEQITTSLIDAFVQRADALYAGPPGPA